MPFLERGKVRERKADRAFDLVDVRAGEEHCGAVSIDTNDRLSAPISRGILQQSEYVKLALRLERGHRLYRWITVGDGIGAKRALEFLLNRDNPF